MSADGDPPARPTCVATFSRALLYLADLLLRPVIVAGCRFDEGPIASKAHLTADIAGAKLLLAAIQTSLKLKIPPAAAWEQNGGTQEGLRNLIASLIAVCFWSQAAAAVVMIPFAPKSGLVLLRYYGWSLAAWIALRPNGGCPAETTPIIYFLCIEEIVMAFIAISTTAHLVLPAAFYLVQLVALGCLTYTIPVRHALILVYTELEIGADDEPATDPPDVEAAAATRLQAMQRGNTARKQVLVQQQEVFEP